MNNETWTMIYTICNIITLFVIAIYTIFTYRLYKEEKRQVFENKFFQLIQLFYNIIDTLNITLGGKLSIEQPHGKECFNYIYGRYKNYYESSTKVEQEPKERIEIAYEKLFDEYQHIIGHYFRNLYNIIKFIDQSKINNKTFYINIIRAQLSTKELLLLFYNCISEKGNEKFKPLIEKYTLLKTMPKNEIIDKEKHISLYNNTAYTKE
jgi:hypothetical protein